MTCSDTRNSGESLDSAAMEDTDKSRVYRLWIAGLRKGKERPYAPFGFVSEDKP